MTTFTRRQVLDILELEDAFLVQLEEESIVTADASSAAPAYSEAMLERIRVASELVRELDVNLPGTAVILHMREEMNELRRRVAELLTELDQRRKAGPRE
jgi:hypothetical protein